MDRLSVRPLSAELAEKAKIELNENPEKVFVELEELRSWLSKQPHINARIGIHLNFIYPFTLLVFNSFFVSVLDDQFLIAFLRGCKYNQELARRKIDSFYTVRVKIPGMFKSRDVTPKLQEILQLGYAPRQKHNKRNCYR